MGALLARVRRQHPDRPVWAAQPRQAAFLKAPEFEILYGGAAGGGKTDALLVAGLVWTRRHPGAQVLFLRRTYPDLSLPGGAIPRSHELYAGHATWNGSEHRWTFPDGGTVQFGHLEHATAHMNYRGAQIDLLLWDELTQATEEQYLFLRSRVRPTKDGIVTGVRAATNPGDVGHVWVKRRWVDAAPWGQPFHLRAPGAEPVSARFVPATLDDNPALLGRDPGYRDRLKELPEHLRRAYEAGDWDIYEGQFFDEWSRDVHVVTPHAIPPHWLRWIAVDYGFADPFCALFCARDPATRAVHVYRELYQAGLHDHRQAQAVRAAIGDERIARVVLDPSMFNKRAEQDKPSIAAVYAAALRGVVGSEAIVAGTNGRRQGWATVRRALVHADGPPRLRVHATCTNVIRTLPAMVRDAIDPEDLADKVRGVKTDDHAADCLRYALQLEATPAQPGARPLRVVG